ncbi:MAG: methyltransferase domain-containing protein [Candidatus Aureabacteria bacterium]|nr:methyltransferase domain-containing protein [Candidatus Auribacterota bacterium]
MHGYDRKESIRLQDQAETLADLLHFDTIFPEGSKVLEAGCGVGAQTVIIARINPGARITSIDISESSIAEAKKKIEAAGIANVTFRQGDVFQLAFQAGSFDHILVCFVLEHLADPAGALTTLRKFLKPGGKITVIEGDHGSAYFYPDSKEAHAAIDCLITLQAEAGGNALIGRELHPLLERSGYKDIRVSPRMVYVDRSKPKLVEGFTKKTFTAMIEGVRESVLSRGLIDQKIFDKGIRDLYRTTQSNGVFCYTFFKAFAEIV